MRALLFNLVVALVSAFPASAEVCLKNDTDTSVEIVPTIERADGRQQTKRHEIVAGDFACISIASDGRWTRLQVYVATVWNNLPANYEYDCPLPRADADLRYRFVGDSPKTYRCEME